jgi:hypothetical protein
LKELDSNTCPVELKVDRQFPLAPLYAICQSPELSAAAAARLHQHVVIAPQTGSPRSAGSASAKFNERLDSLGSNQRPSTAINPSAMVRRQLMGP